MAIRTLLWFLAAAGILTSSAARASNEEGNEDPSWQEEFGLADCKLRTTGRNDFFVLEVGYQLVLESDDPGSMSRSSTKPGMSMG